jgi:raffinose/stachyose/melibiose transport system permease protein
MVWTFFTLAPLVWMFYSSFKSNEEITLDPYSLPYGLFDNSKDVYVVINPDLNVELDYDPVIDKRERLCIESTTVAPGRRYMVFNLLKEQLSPEVAALKPGATLTVSQLPSATQWYIGINTVFFNYVASITKGELGVKFINSVYYTVVSTFFVVFLGLMIGFAVSKLKLPRLSFFVSGAFGLGNLISISSIFIPLFLMLSKAGLTDNPLGVIVTYIAFWLPISVLIASQFISQLPDSLIESAYIDGATIMRTFLSIIFPMCSPVAVTIAIFSALQIWNEFLLILIITNSAIFQSLPVGVYSFSSQTSLQAGWQFAAMVFAIVPVMVVFFTFNKKIARGVVAGAVKG